MQDASYWIPLAVSVLNLATALIGWTADLRRQRRARQPEERGQE